MILVALKRLLSKRILTFVWFLGAVLTIALVVNVQLFSEAASLRVLREVLGRSSPGHPPFALHIYWPWNPFKGTTGQEYAAYRQLSDYLRSNHNLVGLPLSSIVGRVESPPFRVSQPVDKAEGYESIRGLRYRIAFMDQFFEHISVVEGRLPQSARSQFDSVEALVNQSEAMRIGLQLGDRYFLTEETQGLGAAVPGQFIVEIVGLWRAHDNSGDYWLTDPEQWTSLLMVSEGSYAETVVQHLARPIGFCSWYLVFDDAVVRASQINAMEMGMSQLINNAQQLLPGTRSDLYNPLDTLRTFKPRYRSLLLTLALFNVPIIGATVYAMVTFSTLIVSAQQSETAILRSRGASHKQVLYLFFLQAVLVAVISLGPGLLLAQQFTQVMGTVTSFLRFGRAEPLKATIELYHVGTGVAAAALITFTTSMPSRRTADTTIVTYVRERAREQARPVWERYLIDVWLLLLALYGYLQLSRSDAIGLVQRQVASGKTAYSDPLMYAVPVLFLISATMLLMRFFPLFLKFVAFITKWIPGVPFYLSVTHLSRNPRYYAGPLILLVFMISLGVYTADLARTLDTNLRDRIYYAIGTDLVMVETPPGGAANLATEFSTQQSLSQEEEYESTGESMSVLPFEIHRSIPGVVDAARVGRYRTNLKLEADTNPAQFLAIEPHDFARVAFFRSDFATENLGFLMEKLTANPRNVLIPRGLFERTGIGIGQELRFQLNVTGAEEWATLTFVIAGIYDYFPTVYPDERMVIVGNLDYLIYEIGGIGHYHAWLQTEPGTDTLDVIDQIQQLLPIDVPTAMDARELVTQQEALPERVGFFGTLSAGFIGVGGLAVGSYALFAFLSLKRRSIEIGVLRAVGMPKSAVMRSLVYEQVFMLASAVLAAVGLGLAAAYRFVPLIEVGRTLREQVPPYINHMTWSDLGLLLMMVIAVILAALFIVAYIVNRQRIGETLKMADL